jgi:hypothetical protein
VLRLGRSMPHMLRIWTKSFAAVREERRIIFHRTAEIDYSVAEAR